MAKSSVSRSRTVAGEQRRRRPARPAGRARARVAALRNPNAGEVLVSLRRESSLTDLAPALGGGSHGSLEAGDSEVPILTVGLEAEPEVVDLAARSRTGSSRRPTCAGSPMRPEEAPKPATAWWLQRAAATSDEAVLRAMERVPRELSCQESAGPRLHDAGAPLAHGQTISRGAVHGRASWRPWPPAPGSGCRRRHGLGY
jgi:hypothetical protein